MKLLDKESTLESSSATSSYIEMANLSSGSSAANCFAAVSSRSSFRSSVNSNSRQQQQQTSNAIQNHQSQMKSNLIDDVVEFIDEKEADTNINQPGPSAVYNFPWDFKLKSNPLLSQLSNNNNSVTSSNSSSSSSTASLLLLSSTSASQLLMQPPAQPPPPLPQCPPPSSSSSSSATSSLNRKQETESVSATIAAQTIKFEENETQYCAPWDLKLQEEMFKLMSSKLEETNISSTSASLKSKQNIKANDSIRSNKSFNETKDEAENENEYSPPWEHKQSILLQSLVASSVSTPLATSSTVSTLTSSAVQNNNNDKNHNNITIQAQNTSNVALASLFNQFSKTRLSGANRSNTSSSSSTHSSTSSLSTNSPPAMAPPPLPPSNPPPQPPPPLLLSSEQSKCIGRCQQQQNSNNSLLCQQSPRTSNRHLCVGNTINTSSSSLPAASTNLLLTRASSNQQPSSFAIVPGAGGVSGGNFSFGNFNQSNSSSTYLNDTNKFWAAAAAGAAANSNTFDTIASNFQSSLDETRNFSRQTNRSGGGSHHFSFPQHHLQTVPSNGPHEIQVAMPVTALVFSQTSSLPSNLIPLNIQQHQQNSTSLVSPNMSYMNSLERQSWFHGRITRKHAEQILSNKPVGSFLVRQSESGSSNDFSLSLVGSGCVHMRICMKNGEFILGQCSQPFNSIIKMIEHYGKVEVPIKGAQHVKLVMPVPALKT